MANNCPHTFNLGTGYELAALRQLPGVTMDSPATHLLMDFRIHPALTLEPDTPLEEARHFLHNSHTALIAVVDPYGHFCGVLTEMNLTEQSVVQLVSAGHRREDLQARDFMMPRHLILAVEYSEFSRSSVRQVIDTFKEKGVPYLLVTDNRNREIIGIITAKKLARIFDLDLKIEPLPSFMEILDAVKH